MTRTAAADDGSVTLSVDDPSPPVQILEVVVSEAGEKMAVVSVRCSRGRDVVAKVCRSLEPLRLRVVTATIAAAGDAVIHTMFVEIEEMSGATKGDHRDCSCPARCDQTPTQDQEILGGLMPLQASITGLFLIIFLFQRGSTAVPVRYRACLVGSHRPSRHAHPATEQCFLWRAKRLLQPGGEPHCCVASSSQEPSRLIMLPFPKYDEHYKCILVLLFGCEK